MPTPEQNSPTLKRFIAGLLPELIATLELRDGPYVFVWKTLRVGFEHKDVLETEWPYVVQLVEQQLSLAFTLDRCSERKQYIIFLQEECGESGAFIATFNQRATALARVKGAAIEL